MSSPQRYYSDITLQLDVIGALVMRELHSRFGRNNVGYLWLIGEPLLLASVIGSLHALQGGHGGAMAPVPLSIIGYCIFIIFRGIFNRSESLLEVNLPLLYHRMISPLNISLARVIIESAGCFCSMVILLSLCIRLGVAEMPARPLEFLASVAMMTWLSFAAGLNCTALAFDNPTVGRLVHPFTYFMMPLSGAFLPLDWTPKVLADILEWNPMVSIFELARYGMFENAPDKHLHNAYVCMWCAVLTYTGLISLRLIRHKVHLS